MDVTKDIWVGTPIISTITGPSSTPNYQWATFHAEVDFLAEPTGYTWELNPLKDNALYPYGDYLDIAFYSTGYYQVVAKAHNTCGAGPWKVRGVYVYESRSMTIIPMPADNQMTVTIEEAQEKDQAETQSLQAREYEYFLYNDRYQLVRHFTTDMKEVQIKTNDLAEGFYFLNVVSGKKVRRKKVEIRH